MCEGAASQKSPCTVQCSPGKYLKIDGMIVFYFLTQKLYLNHSDCHGHSRRLKKSSK